MGAGPSFNCTEECRRRGGGANLVEAPNGTRHSKILAPDGEEEISTPAALHHDEMGLPLGAPVVEARLSASSKGIGPGSGQTEQGQKAKLSSAWGGQVKSSENQMQVGGTQIMHRIKQLPRSHFHAPLGDQSFLDDVIAQITDRKLSVPGPQETAANGDAPVKDGEREGEKVLRPLMDEKAAPVVPSLEADKESATKPADSVASSPPRRAENVAEDEDAEPKIGVIKASMGSRGSSLQPINRSRTSETPKAIPSYTPRELPQVGELGSRPPALEERRWIEAAVRRMFSLLSPALLEALVDAFREWRLPRSVEIVKQATPVSIGPGLCVLLEGVVDVLHCAKGAKESEKVCTYDRCGQCFGELELFYDTAQKTPRAGAGGRKLHWATIVTRTPVMLWTVDRHALKDIPQVIKNAEMTSGGQSPSASARSPPESARSSAETSKINML
eukprot:TRINITY_DN65699_c0_g1_i1.p1 TRINITY_DN65699_c0_g1~~TRINITY_DN65699_c0_g1_i1.p1  ORF type:complete len:445 (-),score=68.39 TRINITY_DN65699_c0_g1_i1:14-1348(-)